MPTVSLRRFTSPPPLALEVRPLARLRRACLVPETAAWLPPEGPCVLILWHPGPAEPAFAHACGHLSRAGGGWRFDADHGAPAEGAEDVWVVHAFAQRPRHKA